MPLQVHDVNIAASATTSARRPATATRRITGPAPAAWGRENHGGDGGFDSS
ncbi:hypothetical protein PICSAR48_00167 [Mycobacterium avium subsp. paratuberculosis]|nr:hypothetical protein PICSAR48_00167 [Mycobacterium avium subsp. paratuberculosis]